MVGDREKCIQAQMDEYLSKPLKQNQLIQTILKCATLGGALIEHNNSNSNNNNNDQRIQSSNDGASDDKGVSKDDTTSGASADNTPKTPTTPRRPHLEVRGFTQSGNPSLEEPSMVNGTDGGDPVDRYLLRSHSS